MTPTRLKWTAIAVVAVLFSVIRLTSPHSAPGADGTPQRRAERTLPGWRTNVTKRTIDINELKAGGPGKDGIPAIHRPVFVEPKGAAGWVSRNEPVISLEINGEAKAYPPQILTWHEVVTDVVVSALDRERIATSREIGSTGVFDRRTDGQTLTFEYTDGTFTDKQTLSTWDITGRAIEGPLKGKQLTRLPHGDHFAFSWLVFKPDTEVYRPSPPGG